MQSAEILISTGDPNDTLRNYEFVRSPTAIKDTYMRFKDILKERADWILGASVTRDFEDHLTVLVLMRIGPIPKWTEEECHKGMHRHGDQTELCDELLDEAMY